jgi:acyl carrier protein
MDREAALRKILAERYLPPAEVERLRPDDDLFERLDSVQVIRLVAHLEKTLGIVIDDAEIAELSTLGKAASFLDRKRAR